MSAGWLVLSLLVIGIAALAVVLAFPSLRRRLLVPGLLSLYRRRIPPMSQTEREAIDAGTVWWDGDLFSGRPDWNRLLAFPKPALSPEEQAFLEDETETLCAMVTDWET